MGVLDEFWRFALRRPTQSAVRESRPQRGREEIRRRLDLIILAHMWALAPLALVWFLVPAWRDPAQPGSLALFILAASAVAYLLLRTWLNLTRRALGFNAFWPYVDVIIVTTALVIVRNPNDALSVLYFIPLTSAAATLSTTHVIALGIVTVVAYFLAIVLSSTAWTISTVYRLAIIATMASLYSWVLRLVTGHERAAERAEFQRELAREIHDGIQHLLITLGKRLELAEQLVGEAPARATQIVAEERETARRAADELRYLVRRLRGGPPQYTDLATALRLQVATLSERLPFAVDLALPPHLPRLQPAAEHGLLRFIQECLTNVAKHARATQVEVRLAVTDQALACSITDNGVGFDPATATGAGLEGLRERMRALGGTMEIQSASGAGTTIIAHTSLREKGR